MVELFDKAAYCNSASRLLKGSTVHLPGAGRVVMTGDLHDHGPNLNRVLKLAAIDATIQRLPGMGWFRMVGEWTDKGRDRFRDIDRARYEEHRRRAPHDGRRPSGTSGRASLREPERNPARSTVT